MKEKNLPLDNETDTLEELTAQANDIIESLENEKDLNGSVESYQKLIRLNNLIQKKFQQNLKSIGMEANKKVKEIIKK